MSVWWYIFISILSHTLSHPLSLTAKRGINKQFSPNYLYKDVMYQLFLSTIGTLFYVIAKTLLNHMPNMCGTYTLLSGKYTNTYTHTRMFLFLWDNQTHMTHVYPCFYENRRKMRRKRRTCNSFHLITCRKELRKREKNMKKYHSLWSSLKSNPKHSFFENISSSSHAMRCRAYHVIFYRVHTNFFYSHFSQTEFEDFLARAAHLPTCSSLICWALWL